MSTCITNLCVLKKLLMLHKEGLDNKNRALSSTKVFGGLSMSGGLSSSAELISLAMKQSRHHQTI